MKNIHLVPAIVQDLVGKLLNPLVRENEKLNYQIRIEAIKEYCEMALDKNYKNTYNKKIVRK
jgi:hypothetical protein